MRNFTKLKSYLFGCVFLLISGWAYGQPTTVRGTVTDAEAGEALPGATVLEKGTSNGMATGMDGMNPTGLNRKNTMIYLYPII